LDKKLRLSLIFQAAGNATSFLRGMKGETDKASRALGTARQRVNQLQAAARDVAGFRKLETQLVGTRQKLAAAQTEAQRLGRAHAATERPTRQMTAAMEVARRKVGELKEAEQRQAAALQTVRSRLDQAGVSTKRLGSAEIGLARDTRKATEELEHQQKRLDAVNDRQRRMAAARSRYDRTQRLAGTMQSAGQSSVAAGVVAAAPLVLASREAMSFEDGMADVRKVVDFETPRQFRQMGRDILELSTRIPIAKEGLTQIVAAAGQASIARPELLGFAEDAAKMGIAFDTTAEDAGDKMAKWRTAFRMTQPAVRGLADQINYLGNTGPANALQISNIVTRIGPLGEVAGLAAGEIAALGSTIAGMGVEEEIAATGIKNTMLALTKGEAATKSQKAAFSALGLESRAVALGMQRDAGGTIVNVMERIGRLSPERQSAILTQLFGSESVAAIAPLLTNLDLLKGNLAKVASESLYAGSMQKEFEARAATTSNAVKLGTAGLKAMATEFGTAFLPQIRAGAFAMRDMAGRFRTFAEAHPGVIKVVGTLLGVLAAGLLIFGGLAMAVAAVLGPFALLQLALTQAGILFGSGGMLIRGLLLASRGFLAFGAAAARAGLMLLANPITWIILGIIAAVALLAGAGYLIYKNWAGISAWFGGLWEGIKTAASSAIGFLSGIFMRFSPAGILVGAIMKAWPALQALGSQFGTLGRHLLSGLINGVLGGIPALVRAVMSAGGSIISGFKARLGIKSPSRVFAELGDYTMQGMGVGIRRGAAGPIAGMRSAAAAIAAAGMVSAPGLAFAGVAPPGLNPPSVAGQRLAQPTFTSGLRLSPAAGNGTGASARPAGPLKVELHVHAAPGMDVDRLVQLAMEKLQATLSGTGLSRLGDGRDSWGED
tara:strand:- start:3605 stop:6274 length:2670 start_codon:yes stop_codon:yes gene_type:complete